MSIVLLATLNVVSAAPTLRPAAHVQFPASTDCNSPAHWQDNVFYLFNSSFHPSRSFGSDLFHLGDTLPVIYNNTVNGGRWMEATWRATNGILYGWYHWEPGGLCPGKSLTAPKIGAVKSTDGGLNWTDLGVVLEARTNTLRCDAQNGYFGGGNGDFSVMLDGHSSISTFFSVPTLVMSPNKASLWREWLGLTAMRRLEKFGSGTMAVGSNPAWVAILRQSCRPPLPGNSPIAMLSGVLRFIGILTCEAMSCS